MGKKNFKKQSKTYQRKKKVKYTKRKSRTLSKTKKNKGVGIIDPNSDEWKLRCNFLALLTICMGREDVIKKLGKKLTGIPIPLLRVERRSGLQSVDPGYQGLIFAGKDDAGHFHYKPNLGDTIVKNSYDLKWQLDKTNGLCQTYALMGFLIDNGILANPPFVPGDYLTNAKIALMFIRDNCTKIISKVWNEICKTHSETTWYDEHKLNAGELSEDIDKILLDDHLIYDWLVNEHTYEFI